MLLLQKFYTHSHEVVKAKLKPCFFWEGCRKRADNEADIEEESVEDDDDEKADDDREESAVAEVVKKWKGKTAKKPRWCLKALNDFIEIVVNNNVYKKKLIFINTKNQSNGSIYEQILKELKERASARGEKFLFKVSQLRTKFKKMCQYL